MSLEENYYIKYKIVNRKDCCDDILCARRVSIYYRRQIFSFSSWPVMLNLNWWTFAFLIVNILALTLCIILIYLFTCLVRAQRPE